MNTNYTNDPNVGFVVPEDIIDLVGRDVIPWHDPWLRTEVLSALEVFHLCNGREWIAANVDIIRDKIRTVDKIDRGGLVSLLTKAISSNKASRSHSS